MPNWLTENAATCCAALISDATESDEICRLKHDRQNLWFRFCHTTTNLTDNRNAPKGALTPSVVSIVPLWFEINHDRTMDATSALSLRIRRLPVLVQVMGIVPKQPENDCAIALGN